MTEHDIRADVDTQGKTILIGGHWRAAGSGKTIDVFAPSTGEAFTTIAAGAKAEIDEAVAAAREAYEGAWGRVPAYERGRILHRVSELILRDADALAELEALDTGKPMRQAKADITAAARYFEFYGGAADKVHGDTIPFLAGYTVATIREPYGVTGHIIPWNYPAQMFGRTVAPALAMGNAVVLKPAEEACQTPLRLAALCVEAGLPSGALNVVTGIGEEAGAALSAHSGIDFVSFTGSPEVGVLVQKAAADNHIGCTLELGGKSPHIVFADADLERALPLLTGAIVQNGGQTCSAGSRLLVERRFYDEVAGRVAERFEKLVAAPHQADADLGPLISANQKKRVEGFIEGAKKSGVPVLAQGRIADDAPDGGYYVAPRLYGPVPEDDVLAKEEVFGPVLSILPFEDEADALRLANSTEYGLIAAIWSSDGGRQMRLARGVRAGQVYVNGYGAGGGIELPFGGTGKSGHGREKGFEALLEFGQLKTVVLNHG